MSNIRETCDKAVKQFLKSVQGTEPSEQDVENFKEDTNYCDNYIEGITGET